MRKAIGFYKDKKRRTRPITSRGNRWPTRYNVKKPTVYVERGTGRIYIYRPGWGMVRLTEPISKTRERIAETAKEIRELEEREAAYEKAHHGEEHLTWREFVAQRMGPYMRKYGGHGPAMKQIAKEWKAYNKKEELACSALLKG